MKNRFAQRRRKLLEAIKDDSLVVLFAGGEIYKSADETYEFTPNRNFFYLSGIDAPNIIIVLIKRKGEVAEKIFVERPDPVLARWVGEKLSEKEAKEISGIETVDIIDNFNGSIASLLSNYSIDNVCLDLERQEYNMPKTFSQEFAGNILERYPYIKIKNIYDDICRLRVVKDEEEIAFIKKAIDITGEGIENMAKHMRAGMMEYEIEAYFDYTLKKNGVTDTAFKNIISSGKNATVLHYSDNNCKTPDNALILFDVGAQYKYYNGDISRTFPLSSKFTQRQKDVYNVVLETNIAIKEACKAGVSVRELNELSKKILSKGCRQLGLIKDDSELSRYYFHSIGHYLGLDGHDVGDVGDRNFPMAEGTVLTNEPGLYISEEGIGVRIEDDLLVTKSGCEELSHNIIKSVEDIENFLL